MALNKLSGLKQSLADQIQEIRLLNMKLSSVFTVNAIQYHLYCTLVLASVFELQYCLKHSRRVNRVVQNEMKVLIKRKAVLIAHHSHVQSAQMQSLAPGGKKLH